MDTKALPPIPAWTVVAGYTDILYSKADEGIAKITINRPEVRNAFRPETVKEMQRAFDDARDDETIGVVILTGEGREAFCSGGDQRVRGDGGYVGGDGCRGSTCSTCSGRSARCRSRWSRWSPATRSAAATCCTWSAT